MINYLEIYFIIGAAAGIIALVIMIIDKVRRRAHVIANCEVIYEDDKPKSIRFKASNLGRFTVTLNRAGFGLADGRFYDIPFGGALQRIVRPYSTYTYEDDIDFNKIKDVIKQANTTIQYVYFMGENKAMYKGAIPENLNNLIQS